MECQTYYLTKIKENLSLRQRSNPLYSLRAYARDLGVHPSTLSQILKGKRPLPVKDSAQVIEKMNLGPTERTLFLDSLMRSKVALDNIKSQDFSDRYMLDESHHSIIAEWEHYAVLELFELEDFECTVPAVTTRLAVTPNRAEVVLNNLRMAGLLTWEDGRYVKVHGDVRTTEDIQNQALKDSHKETLLMGMQKLEDIELDLRDFSSSTLAIDLEKLPEAKAIIREFRQKMAALLKDGKRTEVYQLAIQFYPLTDLQKPECL